MIQTSRTDDGEHAIGRLHIQGFSALCFDPEVCDVFCGVAQLSYAVVLSYHEAVGMMVKSDQGDAVHSSGDGEGGLPDQNSYILNMI